MNLTAVLVGALGAENMPDEHLKDAYTRMTATNRWPTPETLALVGTPEDILAGVPLRFRTQGIGTPHDVDLIPFYQLHHQRYTVYWQLLS